MQLNINPVFQNLIPPMSGEELEQLEKNILQDGCRDALTVWSGTIIDGHNRYKICTENKLPFNVVEMSFADEEEAKIWIIEHQFGRRNLSAVDRARLALQMKSMIAARAKENLQIAAEMTNAGLQKSVKAVNTQKEIAELAGVSHDTIHKVEFVDTKAPEPIKQEMGKALTINKAYLAAKTAARMPQNEADKYAAAVVKQAEERMVAERKKEFDEIDRKHTVWKILSNAVWKVADADKYVTAANIEILMERGLTGVDDIADEIQEAIDVLQRMKDLVNDYENKKVVKFNVCK